MHLLYQTNGLMLFFFFNKLKLIVTINGFFISGFTPGAAGVGGHSEFCSIAD
jgi:hypothetical protein